MDHHKGKFLLICKATYPAEVVEGVSKVVSILALNNVLVPGVDYTGVNDSRFWIGVIVVVGTVTELLKREPVDEKRQKG